MIIIEDNKKIQLKPKMITMEHWIYIYIYIWEYKNQNAVKKRSKCETTFYSKAL